MLLGADGFDPESARDVGLVDEVVPQETLEERCFTLAAKLGRTCWPRTSPEVPAAGQANHAIHHPVDAGTGPLMKQMMGAFEKLSVGKKG